MRKARSAISLADLGIEQTRVRFAGTSGMLIEVYGLDNKVKADQLASRLKEVVPAGVMLSCPKKMTDIKMIGVDDSVTAHRMRWCKRLLAKRNATRAM